MAVEIAACLAGFGLDSSFATSYLELRQSSFLEAIVEVLKTLSLEAVTGPEGYLLPFKPSCLLPYLVVAWLELVGSGSA